MQSPSIFPVITLPSAYVGGGGRATLLSGCRTSTTSFWRRCLPTRISRQVRHSWKTVTMLMNNTSPRPLPTSLGEAPVLGGFHATKSRPGIESRVGGNGASWDRSRPASSRRCMCRSAHAVGRLGDDESVHCVRAPQADCSISYVTTLGDVLF